MADERLLPFRERAYENYREEMEDMSRIALLLEEKETGEIDDFREPLSCDVYCTTVVRQAAASFMRPDP